MVVHEFLAKNKTLIMPQPPYSPELADFCLFPKLKLQMKGKRFSTIEEIKDKSSTGNVGDTKKHVSEVLRELKKMLA